MPSPRSSCRRAFDRFDVVAGPTCRKALGVDRQRQRNQDFVFTYTYVIQASSVGKASISAASVRWTGRATDAAADDRGDRRRSFSPPGAGGGKSRRGGAVGEAGGRRSAGWVAVNRNNVFKGQPIRATFKIYTRVQLGGLIMLSIRHSTVSGQDLDVQGYGWQRRR